MFTPQPARVQELPYGEKGKRYLFPNSFAIIVEPAHGEHVSASIHNKHSQSPSPNYCEEDRFKRFKLEGGKLILKESELPELVQLVQNLDLNWRFRN